MTASIFTSMSYGLIIVIVRFPAVKRGPVVLHISMVRL